MKMFLTRLGVNSKAVVTGDVTQIDLKSPESSGLVRIQTILGGMAGMKFVYFHPEDVVRHRLVRDILQAFESYHARVDGKEEDGVGESLEAGAQPSPATADPPAAASPATADPPDPSAADPAAPGRGSSL
jgi:hypothetical protein